jgi:hypothetical protein
MLLRSQKTRGWISERTLERIARRKNVRGAVESQLSGWLDYYGVCSVSLDRGGWGLLAKSALEGAQTLTADLLKKLTDWRSGTFDPSPMITELGYGTDETGDDEPDEPAKEPQPSPAAAPAWTPAPNLREARPGSKRRIAVDVMRANPDLPMRELLPMIVKAEGAGFNLADARSYYTWIVDNNHGPGEDREERTRSG